MSEETKAPKKLSLGWLVVHWGIIINFLMQIFYGSYMVFFVVRPEGVSGPLWQQAHKIPHEMMVTRRLYASETWVAIAGLCIYLAITEIGPRMWLNRKDS